MQLRMMFCFFILSIVSVAQTAPVYQNPVATQIITQPSGTYFEAGNILFANPSIALSTLISNNCSTECTIYLSPGTYTGPTNLHSNISLIALSPPANLAVIGSVVGGTDTASAAAEVRLTYTSNLALTDVQNLYMKGITLDFCASNSTTGACTTYSGAGVVLASSSYNRFDDVTILGAGGSGQPALEITSSTTYGNSAKNTFTNLNVSCYIPSEGSDGTSCSAGILLEGTLPVAGGSGVTDNTFSTVAISGCQLYAIDMEANSDSNHFYNVDAFLHGSCPTANTSVLAFNTTTVTADIDADASYFNEITKTGSYEFSLVAGISYGHIITGHLPLSPPATGAGPIDSLTSTSPSFTYINAPTGSGGTSVPAQVLTIGGHIGTSGPGLENRGDVTGACAVSSGACSEITFHAPYQFAPSCVVGWQSSGGHTGSLSANPSTTGLTPTSTVSSDSGTAVFICFGNPD